MGAIVRNTSDRLAKFSFSKFLKIQNSQHKRWTCANSALIALLLAKSGEMSEASLML